jgi:DNA-binding XRE family transcriptional regulator
MSQVTFAKMVGTSSETIKSVELGRLQLSEKLARRISVQFGVVSKSLMRKTGKPEIVDGVTLTVKDWKFFNSHKSEIYPPSKVLEMIFQSIRSAEALLYAANQPSKMRVQALYMGMNEFFYDLASDMGLLKEWKECSDPQRLKEERSALQKAVHEEHHKKG